MKNDYFKGVLILISTLGFLNLRAQNQTYTRSIHVFGCQYTERNVSFEGYGAIGAVTIRDQLGNIVYYKSSDGCNESVPTSTGHYTLVEPYRAFNLLEGASYEMTIEAFNPIDINTTSGDIGVGVWIDFNGNGDFGDTDDWVTPENFAIRHLSENSFSFTVPCNYNAGTIRMRIRSNASAVNESLHSSKLGYGETEDFACGL